MADPRCLKDLKNLGFNLFSTANNHAMDYSCNGLLATMKYLQEYDIPFSSTGINLSDASKPAYVECSGGRVALISVTSSFHDSYAAGPQNQEMQGRPGVAPLRHAAIYDLDEKNYDDLCRIAKDSGINAYHGLGNFIFQHELVDYCPEELYNRYGLTRQSSTGPEELFRVRSKNGTIGAKTMPDCYRSVIASVKYKDGSMETSLVPVEIDVSTGLPQITKDISILERLEQLSETYHTKIILDKDKAKGYIYAN